MRSAAPLVAELKKQYKDLRFKQFLYAVIVQDGLDPQQLLALDPDVLAWWDYAKFVGPRQAQSICEKLAYDWDEVNTLLEGKIR